MNLFLIFNHLKFLYHVWALVITTPNKWNEQCHATLTKTFHFAANIIGVHPFHLEPSWTNLKHIWTTKSMDIIISSGSIQEWQWDDSITNYNIYHEQNCSCHRSAFFCLYSMHVKREKNNWIEQNPRTFLSSLDIVYTT